MKRPENLKVGDQFRVIEKNTRFDVGDIITLGRMTVVIIHTFGMEIDLIIGA